MAEAQVTVDVSPGSLLLGSSAVLVDFLVTVLECLMKAG